MSDEQNPSEQLNEYIKIYLGNKSNLQDELEIRFGTKHWNTLSKIDLFNDFILTTFDFTFFKPLIISFLSLN